MILGKVVGTVWATRKSPRLEGVKLLLIRPRGWYRPPHDTGLLVAADPVGVGVGEEVVVCLGQPARLALGDPRYPVEAAVLGVVDRVDLPMVSTCLPGGGGPPGSGAPG